MTYEWSTADIMAGKMFVGGPQWAKSCPGCGSPNISKKGSLAMGTEIITCSDCRAIFGGASARA